MADTKLYPSIKAKLLKTDVLSTDTAIRLRDIVWYTTSDGTDTNLTAADFGDIAYGVFEPRTAREEFFTWDPTTVANATTTGFTTINRGLKPGANYSTVVPGLKFNHPTGSKVVLFTNAPAFYNDFANLDNDETITETWTFTNTNIPKLNAYLAPTLDEELAPKKYVDDVAVAGAPDASTTVKGIVEIATGAELAAGTNVGGTGAIVVASGGSFKNSSAGAGDVNKVPVLNASGELDATFIDNASTTARGQVEIATAAETAAGTGTGGTGAVLVPDNANFLQAASTTLATDASKVPMTLSTGVLQSEWTGGTGTSGEAISIGHGLYLKASDGKLYKSLGTGDESTFSFVGVATSAAAGADSTVRFARPGQIATGLAGLTAGSYYYVTDVAGTLGTTPGTRYAKVGQAMSTTTMRVIEPKFVTSGTQSITSATTFAQTTGFYPARVIVHAGGGGAGGRIQGISVGDDSQGCFYTIPGNTATGNGTANGSAWLIKDDLNNTQNSGAVTLKTATGFTLDCGSYTTTASVKWIAYSE